MCLGFMILRDGVKGIKRALVARTVAIYKTMIIKQLFIVRAESEESEIQNPRQARVSEIRILKVKRSIQKCLRI